jgi:hypothetical protein
VGRRRIYENDTARVRAYRQRIAGQACAARLKASSAVAEAERLKLRVAVLEADNAGLRTRLQALAQCPSLPAGAGDPANT